MLPSPDIIRTISLIDLSRGAGVSAIGPFAADAAGGGNPSPRLTNNKN
jgi:hypothetical protein